MSQRPYVRFSEVKERISIEDCLEVLGIREQFRQQGKGLSGVCPLPQHQHGPQPNPDQFKINRLESGESVFFCHGDCKRGGDVILFGKLMTGLSDAHIRFWFPPLVRF